jgi:hypothetical protein
MRVPLQIKGLEIIERFPRDRFRHSPLGNQSPQRACELDVGEVRNLDAVIWIVELIGNGESRGLPTTSSSSAATSRTFTGRRAPRR